MLPKWQYLWCTLLLCLIGWMGWMPVMSYASTPLQHSDFLERTSSHTLPTFSFFTNGQVNPKTQMPKASDSKTLPVSRSEHWFVPSYWIDWGITAVLIGAGSALAFAPPFEQPFQARDFRINQPHRENSISTPLAGILSVSVPLLTFGVAQIALRSGHNFHHAALGLMENLALTFFFTNLLKNAIGRHRPDFLARCQPNARLECQGEVSEVAEGRRSFPSGHTSMLFAGGVYTMLYLWGTLKPLRGPGTFWKVPLLLLPITAATLASITRLHDNRHHWEDVVVGALLGSAFAFLTYHLHFPAPWSNTENQPHKRTRIALHPIATFRRVGLRLQGSF